MKIKYEAHSLGANAAQGKAKRLFSIKANRQVLYFPHISKAMLLMELLSGSFAAICK